MLLVLLELLEVKKNNENWQVKTNKGTEFSTPNIIIAGGVGSFEPRKFSPKECENFENKSIFYSIKDKSIFKGKMVSIFGGGDSALDWTIELSKDSKVNLIHRRDEFRGTQTTVDTNYPVWFPFDEDGVNMDFRFRVDRL